MTTKQPTHHRSARSHTGIVALTRLGWRVRIRGIIQEACPNLLDDHHNIHVEQTSSTRYDGAEQHRTYAPLFTVTPLVPEASSKTGVIVPLHLSVPKETLRSFPAQLGPEQDTARRARTTYLAQAHMPLRFVVEDDVFSGRLAHALAHGTHFDTELDPTSSDAVLRVLKAGPATIQDVVVQARAWLTKPTKRCRNGHWRGSFPQPDGTWDPTQRTPSRHDSTPLASSRATSRHHDRARLSPPNPVPDASFADHRPHHKRGRLRGEAHHGDPTRRSSPHS